MTDIINISVRVQHNPNNPGASPVLIFANVDDAPTQPAVAAGALGRISHLITQLIEDALIQARAAHEQQEAQAAQTDGCETGCEVDLPSTEIADTPPVEDASDGADEPQLTLLNFG